MSVVTDIKICHYFFASSNLRRLTIQNDILIRKSIGFLLRLVGFDQNGINLSSEKKNGFFLHFFGLD